MFSWLVAVEGRPNLRSSSRLSLSLLNSAAHFFTVDKAYALFPKLETISVLISLFVIPFFCKYLITSRCQILSILTESSKNQNAKFSSYDKISLVQLFKLRNYLSSIRLPKKKYRSLYQESMNLTHGKFHRSVTTPS